MTDKIKQILDNMRRYNNTSNLANSEFGLDETVVYDALVIAPSYGPDKIIKDASFRVTKLPSDGHCQGYLVEKDNVKLAWVKTAVGACNMLDYLLICGKLQFKKLIFIGAVGALNERFNLGDICTPSYSIAGTLANTYLKDSLRDYVPFEQIYPDKNYVTQVIELAENSGYSIKEGSVFCTDSIIMEYTHLDEIKALGVDLVEMETATFYEIAKMMEIPAIAILVVSDNSATGIPIAGRTEEMQKIYEYSKFVVLPDMIYKIAKS